MFAGSVMLGSAAYAGAEEKATKPSTTAPTEAAQSPIQFSGANTIFENTESNSQNYTSTKELENAVLVSGGRSTLSNAVISKSGDTDDVNALIYGTNFALLAYNSAVLSLDGGYISTAAKNAGAVFAYGESQISLSGSYVNTSGKNSGGLVVAGTGNISARNVTLSTIAESSPAISANAGGGAITADGGTFTASGKNSPAVYSKSYVDISGASLVSTEAEGIVIDNDGSVTLKNVGMTSNNISPSDGSDTSKGIMLYNSKSEAAESMDSFKAENSKFVITKGDTFFVANTGALIELKNNTVINTDGDFLRIQSGKWGKDGSNGGNVTLNMTSQRISGDILVDEISSLTMSLEGESVYEGAINSENTAAKLAVSLSSESSLSLTADTYLTSLTNEKTDNSNIFLNGHRLFVNGKEAAANSANYTADTTVEPSNSGEAQASTSASETKPVVERSPELTSEVFMIVGIIAAVVVILVLIVAIYLKKNGYSIQKRPLENNQKNEFAEIESIEEFEDLND